MGHASGWRRAALIGLWLLALCGSAWGQSGNASKPSQELIAVMDLQAVGASPAEAQALSDRLREVMLKTGRVKLVERSQIDQVLNEQALQQTGCTSQECAVQVGRLLGVRKLVVGKVVKVSDEVWLLSAILVDVETGETLRAESVRHKGDYFALMDERVREIGGKFSEDMAGPGPEKAMEAPPAAPAPKSEPAKLRLALFPSLLYGKNIDRVVSGRSVREWILDGVRKGLAYGTDLEVVYSVYAGFGLEPVTHQVSEDSTWTGFLFKEVDKDSVRSWARDLKLDAVLTLSVEVSGRDGPVDVYLYDAIKDRWYERSGRWNSGHLSRDVAAKVSAAVTEFTERNGR